MNVWLENLDGEPVATGIESVEAAVAALWMFEYKLPIKLTTGDLLILTFDSLEEFEVWKQEQGDTLVGNLVQ